jgi:MraZ protein
MALFLSTFTNKIDKKGRISIPAQFRLALANQDFAGVIVYESFVNPCIEGCDMERIRQLSESIDNLDPFSETRDAFATAILGGAMQLSFDSDGRVTLPESLIEITGITEKAVFVGKGTTFEIWHPEKFEEYAKKAKEDARQNRGLLRLAKTTPNQ